MSLHHKISFQWIFNQNDNPLLSMTKNKFVYVRKSLYGKLLFFKIVFQNEIDSPKEGHTTDKCNCQ